MYAKCKFLGEYKDHKVGHIVAHHFIRPRKKGEIVIRKNGITTDDYAGNLEYVTEKELGIRNGYRSRSQPVVKLCPKTFEKIEEYRSAREAGRKNYLSHQTVLDNCHGRTKKAVGTMRFMFLEDYEKDYGDAYFELEKKLIYKERKNDRYREALEFYANEEIYNPRNGLVIFKDSGKRARLVLSETKEKKQNE